MSTTDTADGALSVRNLVVGFDGVPVLHDIALRVEAEEFVVVLGPSGGGKSTLLKAIAGLLNDSVQGDISYEGPLSFGFQDARLLPWRRVWQNVVFGSDKGGRRKQRAAALSALREVGLESQANAWPRTLSGGEAQRVALARALFRRPRLLLLDEPFGALDALTRLRMQDLVVQLWEQHRLTVVFVTHDVEEAVLLGDRVIVLGDGGVLVDRRIDLPRPRDRAEGHLRDLHAQLLNDLGVHVAHQQA